MMQVGPKVTMAADLDVIPADPNSPIAKIGLEATAYGGGRPFKGEATPVSSKTKSTEDDLNLLVELDEPDLVVKALFKIATLQSNNPKWAIIAQAMAAASVELDEANAPTAGD